MPPKTARPELRRLQAATPPSEEVMQPLGQATWYGALEHEASDRGNARSCVQVLDVWPGLTRFRCLTSSSLKTRLLLCSRRTWWRANTPHEPNSSSNLAGGGSPPRHRGGPVEARRGGHSTRARRRSPPRHRGGPVEAWSRWQHEESRGSRRRVIAADPLKPAIRRPRSLRTRRLAAASSRRTR